MSELESALQAYKKPVMSVGEEFIAWAETYWKIDTLLDNAVKNPAEKGGECCSYDVIRPYFIEKINSLIADRVKHYM